MFVVVGLLTIGTAVAASMGELDAADVWTTPPTQFVPPSGGSYGQPSIVTSPSGSVTALWVATESGNDRVLTARSTGSTWSAPVAISPWVGSAQQPQVVQSPDGTMTVVWVQVPGQDPNIEQIMTSRYEAGVWGSPVVLTSGSDDIGELVLGSSPDGSITAAWVIESPTVQPVVVARFVAGAWSTPVAITGASIPVETLSLATSVDGSVMLAWTVFGNSTRRIEYARSVGGTWGPATVLAMGAAGVELAAGPDGSVVGVWTAELPQVPPINFPRSEVVAARFSSGSWGAPVPISAIGYFHLPAHVDIGPDGVATAVWTRMPGSPADSPGYVEVARSSGGQWSAPYLIASDGYNLSFQPPPQTAVAAGPGRSVTMAWSRINESGHRVVETSRWNGTGWGSEAVVSDPASGLQPVDPAVSSGADGSVTVSWTAQGSGGLPISVIELSRIVAPPTFVALTPVRIVNTRGGPKVGALGGSGAPLVVNVLGKGGLPANGVGAVALNVTVTDTESPTVGGGYVSVYPCGTRPDASNLNFVGGESIPNLVIAPVSPSGDVCIYVYGKAHVLADVSGFFPVGSTFRSLIPSRVVNTRPTGRVGAADGNGVPLKVKLAALGGLPGSGIGAVALNVTVTDTENPAIGGGYVTVYPCGTRPDASNLNFTTGQTIPNAVIAPVSADGEVCFYVYGTANILADVSGYFPAGSPFQPLVPARVVNTRSMGKVGAADGSGAPLKVKLAGQGGLPSGGVAAVALNVTVTDTESPTLGGGYVTVYPCGERPDASNLNFVAGQTIPNSVIAPLSPNGEVCFYVYGRANILADVSGYFPS